MRTRGRITTRTMALTAMLSAVSLLFLFIAGVLPAGWLGVTAVAGLVVAVSVSAAGYTSGVFCWLISGLLGLLLVPVKRISLLFLFFLGLYPILKRIFESLQHRVLEYLLKLGTFNLAFLLIYRFAFAFFFPGALSGWDFPIPLFPVFLIGGNVVFLIYDYAFSKLMGLLQARLVARLRRRMK